MHSQMQVVKESVVGHLIKPFHQHLGSTWGPYKYTQQQNEIPSGSGSSPGSSPGSLYSPGSSSVVRAMLSPDASLAEMEISSLKNDHNATLIIVDQLFRNPPFTSQSKQYAAKPYRLGGFLYSAYLYHPEIAYQFTVEDRVKFKSEYEEASSLMYDDHIALPPKFMNSAGAMAAIFDMSLMAHFESSPACLQEIQSSGVWLTQKKCFGCWTLHKQLSWMPGSLIKHITSANHCANPT
jgi:hypothetical protein